MLLSLFLES